nr:hypothetical protein CFP56_72719 [Quercus suber]
MQAYSGTAKMHMSSFLQRFDPGRLGFQCDDDGDDDDDHGTIRFRYQSSRDASSCSLSASLHHGKGRRPWKKHAEMRAFAEVDRAPWRQIPDACGCDDDSAAPPTSIHIVTTSATIPTSTASSPRYYSSPPSPPLFPLVSLHCSYSSPSLLSAWTQKFWRTCALCLTAHRPSRPFYNILDRHPSTGHFTVIYNNRQRTFSESGFPLRDYSNRDCHRS